MRANRRRLAIDQSRRRKWNYLSKVSMEIKARFGNKALRTGLEIENERLAS